MRVNMAQLLLGFFILCLACIYTDADTHAIENCGPDEILAQCGKLCESTCTRQENQSCKVNFRACSSGCRCQEGLYRNEITGKCVTSAQCPARSDIKDHVIEDCGLDEILAQCGNVCEPTCTRREDQSCNPVFYVCSRGCRCKEGLYRNEVTGQCVTSAQCLIKSDTHVIDNCGPDEILAQCGRFCESTCTRQEKQLCKVNFRACSSGCRCQEGLYRNEVTGKCVTSAQCPTQSGVDIRSHCSSDETLVPCEGFCEPTCSKRNEESCEVTHPACVEKCRCKKGLFRNETTGHCVLSEECEQEACK